MYDAGCCRVQVTSVRLASVCVVLRQDVAASPRAGSAMEITIAATNPTKTANTVVSLRFSTPQRGRVNAFLYF